MAMLVRFGTLPVSEVPSEALPAAVSVTLAFRIWMAVSACLTACAHWSAIACTPCDAVGLSARCERLLPARAQFCVMLDECVSTCSRWLADLPPVDTFELEKTDGAAVGEVGDGLYGSVGLGLVRIRFGAPVPSVTPASGLSDAVGVEMAIVGVLPVACPMLHSESSST